MHATSALTVGEREIGAYVDSMRWRHRTNLYLCKS